MKKILTVITTGMSPYGGLTTVAMNYYRQLNLNTIHMDFASTNLLDRELEAELLNHGSVYYKLSSRSKSPYRYFRELLKLCKKYDVIHIHANSATATVELMAAKLAGVRKRIIHIHNTTCTHKIIHRMLKPVFDRSYTDAISCSKAAGEWIFPQNKYIVLNNAINLKEYSYNPHNRKYIRDTYGIGNEILVGNVGKLIEQKNHTFLLDIFYEFLKQEPTAKLMVVGGGILENKLKKKTAKLGISDNVIFCGMQNSAVPFLSAFDIILFPSLWEGLPLAILEAQANGLNCVVSENVTFEVDMGGVVRISLNNGISDWSDCLRNNISGNREQTCESYCMTMHNKGYDIEANVNILEKMYRG